MKKTMLVLVSMLVLWAGSNAQKGTYHIGIGAEAAIPTGDLGNLYNTGPGAFVRGAHSVNRYGQVTVAAGVSSFAGNVIFTDANGNATNGKDKLLLIPVLAGYRHHFSRLYIEPQMGLGFTSQKLETGNIKMDQKVMSAPWWAAGVGYILAKGLDVGIRYQRSGELPRNSNTNVSFVGLQLSYSFSLK